MILHMSFTGSVVILSVLFLRFLLRKAPKIYSYTLWILVLFRLLCPVSVSSTFSALNWLPIPEADVPSLETDTTASSQSSSLPPVYIPSQHVESYGSEKAEFPIAIVRTGIWLCGVIVLVFFNLYRLWQLRRLLIGATPLRDNLYLADHISIPFVLGVIRPKIYLPSTLGQAEQSFIIQHEQHHIRRGDHIFKLLGYWAVCLHWFNPLVWLAFFCACRDMEMSCDEAVIRKQSEDIRAAYSTSLLHFSIEGHNFPKSPLAFGQGNPKRRIQNIMKYRKPTILVTACALIICLTAGVCFATNPKDSDKSEKFPVEIIDQMTSDSAKPASPSENIQNSPEIGTGATSQSSNDGEKVQTPDSLSATEIDPSTVKKDSTADTSTNISTDTAIQNSDESGTSQESSGKLPLQSSEESNFENFKESNPESVSEVLEGSASQESADAQATKASGDNSTTASGNNAAADGVKFTSPLKTSAAIALDYGPRVHPVTGQESNHNGVDLSVESGTPVYAVQDGTISSAQFETVYGNCVIVDHGNGYTSRYGHLESYKVQSGDTVCQGDLIGYVGSTGWATGSHLHLELSCNGETIDPMDYIALD